MCLNRPSPGLHDFLPRCPPLQESPLLLWAPIEKGAVTLSLPPYVIKAALLFFLSCVILYSLIFKKIFYWKTTAPDTHKHMVCLLALVLCTSLPAFRKPILISSISSWPNACSSSRALKQMQHSL